VGYRFGKYLGEATSLAVSYCEAAQENEGDDELREHCLQVCFSAPTFLVKSVIDKLVTLLQVCRCAI